MLTVRETADRSRQIKQEANPDTARRLTAELAREVLLTIAAGHRQPRTLASAALTDRE